MTVIVHPVEHADLDAWLDTVNVHLLNSPNDPDSAARRENRRRTWVPQDAWAVRDRGTIVGTLAVQHRTMTLPGGGIIGIHALTGVSVAATHRRRGLLRAMLTEALSEAHERGDALSGLVAAEWPIYGRYGYAPATQEARFTYRIRGRGAAPTVTPTGVVRPISTEELGGIAPSLFERARQRRAGQFDRDDAWWPRRLGVGGFVPVPSETAHWVVHEDDDGAVDGMLGWRTTRDFDIDNSFGAASVHELITATDAAEVALWCYLAGLDAVEEITFDNRPVDEPARWLLADGRALRQDVALDGLWLRLLDVPAALSARRYATDDELVFDVLDSDAGGYGAGRFVLSAHGGEARCEPTSANADLQLTQRALASSYLGGYRLRALVPAGGVTELVPGALDRADALLSTGLAPWNQTHF